jgi:SAM-dependent methyltransferase
MSAEKRLQTPGAVSWDERYDKAAFHYGTEPNDFLRASAGLIPAGGTVLCLAEGEGRNAIHLAKCGFRVTAVDQSAVGLRKLGDWALREGLSIETLLMDLEDHDPGIARWDAVVSIWCHLPPGLREKVHARASAALKPGGLMILEAYHPRQLEYKTGGPPVPELMMSAGVLRRDFASLGIEWLSELDRDVREGTGHAGMSAVVQLIARKV